MIMVEPRMAAERSAIPVPVEMFFMVFPWLV
jgi:hypothetical protein